MIGSIESLARNMDYFSMHSERSIKKIASSGDPVRQAAIAGEGAGAVSFASRMSSAQSLKEVLPMLFKTQFL